MQRLSVFENLAMSAEPMTDRWTGALDHIGPVQTITPLMEMIGGKTTCGTVTLMSGVMLWGAERLRPFTPVDYLEEIAEAIFAWQHDWRYVDFFAGVPGKSPNGPPALSAAMMLRQLFLLSISEPEDWHSFYQPIMKASHMINITEFILPASAKEPFQGWLRAISNRLDQIAEIPDIKKPVYSEFQSEEAFDAYCAPRRGGPIPPVVFDLSVDINALDLAQAFVATLDHTQNRYLRSPQQMIELGFVGTPYESAA